MDTFLGELFLVAGYADGLVVLGNKGLYANWLHARLAQEALLVVVLALEFVLLHACMSGIRWVPLKKCYFHVI